MTDQEIFDKVGLPDPSPLQENQAISVGDQAAHYLAAIDEYMSEGRYKSLAITALEESLAWAHKGMLGPTSGEQAGSNTKADGES